MNKEDLVKKLGLTIDESEAVEVDSEIKVLLDEIRLKEEESRQNQETLKQLKINEERLRTHRADLNDEICFYKKKIQVETESNARIQEQRKLIRHNISRTEQGTKLIQKQIDQINLRLKSKESQLNQLDSVCGALKTGKFFEEEKFLQFLKETGDAEDQKLNLMKYVDQDDAKIRELYLSIEKLQAEKRKAKTDLEEKNTDVYIAQTKLDSIQKEFQKSFKERLEIINIWENVLNRIRGRKDEIMEYNENLEALDKEKAELLEKQDQQDCLHESELDKSKCLNREVSELESTLSKLKLISQDELKKEENAEAHLRTMKNSAMALNSLANKTKREIDSLTDDIKKKCSKIEDMDKAMSDLKADFDNLTTENFDADKWIRELELNLQLSNSKYQKLKTDYDFLNRGLLADIQEMKNLEAEANALESQKKGSEASNKNMANIISKLDNQRLQQKTLIYKIDFSLEQLQRRIRTMQGQMTNDEERLKMENKKSKLKSVFKEAVDAMNFLDFHVRNTMEKVTVANTVLEVSRKQCQDLETKIHSLECYAENGLKTMKNLVERKEDLLVNHCEVSMQLNRYRELLKKKNQRKTNLKSSQMEFETEWKSKLLKMKGAANMTQVEIRKEDEELSKVKKQVQLCVDKLKRAQLRYDMALKALGIQSMDESSKADFIVKAEEEKRILTEERDNLNVIVAKQEKDLQATRNTLAILQRINRKIDESQHPEERAALKELEIKERIANIDYSETRQKLLDANVERDKLQTKVEELKEFLAKLEDIYSEKEIVHSNLVSKLASQQEKIARANKQNSKLTREVNKGCDYDLENDIKIYLLRHIVKDQTSSLISAIRPKPSLLEETVTILEEAGIKIPTVELNIRRRSTRSSNSK